MRFLLIERPRTKDDVLAAFDTASLDLETDDDCASSALMNILDYIEQNPDLPVGKHLSFWRFVTDEVWEPDAGRIDKASQHEPDSRWLDVFALEDDAPEWTLPRLQDQSALRDVRANYPPFAVVPLRRGRPSLCVMSGS